MKHSGYTSSCPLNLLPVGPALDELANVLQCSLGGRASVVNRVFVMLNARGENVPLTIRLSVPRHVPHDLCKIFCILNDKNVSEHLEPEVVEIRRHVRYLGNVTMNKKRIKNEEKTPW